MIFVSVAPARWCGTVPLRCWFDVVPGLDYANRALNACSAARERDPSACPNPDQVRMELYQANLAAVGTHAEPVSFPVLVRTKTGETEVSENEGHEDEPA